MVRKTREQVWRELDALGDTSSELAARQTGLSKGVKRAVGSVALAFLLARRKR